MLFSLSCFASNETNEIKRPQFCMYNLDNLNKYDKAMFYCCPSVCLWPEYPQKSWRVWYEIWSDDEL